jgi:alpha,alpha-trehalose-phosphate synthase [UDP-forming]
MTPTVTTINQPHTAEVSQSRLVIVSNREPFTITVQGKEVHLEKTPGGLVSALDPVLKKRGGLWICWEGSQKRVPEFDDVTVLDEDIDWDHIDIPYQIETVALTEQEINHYYFGYANTRIWPLFHYFVSRCNFFDEQDWPSYISANQKFAQAIVDHTTNDDWIWVQDYHLLLVPEFVRLKASQRKLAFFLHIPFPTYEIFRILPKRHVILKGMLGSDLIGFHVPEYADYFMDCVQHLLPEAVIDRETMTIVYENRIITVGSYPISIDFKQVEIMADQPEIKAAAAELRQKFGVDHIGLSVDRMDYSKGIRENLEAVRFFFEKYPEYKKRFTFIQIAAPTRSEVPAYQQMKEEIDTTVGRINGALAEDNWLPIHYYYRSFPMDDVMPYFLAADVIMITPLRDGMNLVAKEYCAAKRDLTGVLMLSEFTGAAHELKQALPINPFHIESVADTLYLALQLPEQTIANNMKALRNTIQQYDIHAWVTAFIDGFEQAIAARYQREVD